jgi:carbonic anhydrase
MGYYVCSKPWSPQRPEALVVCCSDGRFHPHVEEFIRGQVSEKPDLLAIPGGPVAIDPWSSSFDHARVFEESLRLFTAHHELRSVWLIAHQGCAFYREKYGNLRPEELRGRQIRDLLSARRKLQELQPRLEVHLIYASLEGDRVGFSDLEEAESSTRT